MDQQVAALLRRVERLERQCRRQRGGAVAALALLTGLGAAWSQAGPRTTEVQARRFVLVAEDGTPRATLEATGDGSVLALRDVKGRDRVRLEAAAEESRVSVGGLANSQVVLANGGLAPRLALADAGGKERLWVALRFGSPSLQFLDEQGRVRSGLTTFNDDAGVALISSTDRPSPGVVLYGKDRSVVWSAP